MWDGPGAYSASEKCTMKVNKPISLDVKLFDLESDAECRYDYLQVNAGSKYCGARSGDVAMAARTLTFSTSHQSLARAFLSVLASALIIATAKTALILSVHISTSFTGNSSGCTRKPWPALAASPVYAGGSKQPTTPLWHSRSVLERWSPLPQQSV